MFWQDEDGVDVEGLRRQFEREQREGIQGYYSQAELEQLLEWYLARQQYKEAQQVIGHAAYLYPTSQRLLIWKSRLAYEKGHYTEAYVHGMAAFHSIEMSSELYEHLVETCMAAEHVEAAMQVLDAWWEEAPSNQERSRSAAFLAEELIGRGRLVEAIPLLWRGWEVDPENRLYFPFRLVTVYRQAGLLAEGIHAFQAYLWQYPEEVGLWLGLARLYIDKCAYAQAAQALKQAEQLLAAEEIERNTHWGSLYRLWARYYEEQKQEAAAFRAWLQAREYTPYHPQVLTRLLAYYQRWEEWDAAEAYVHRLQEKAPHFPSVRWQIAEYLWTRDRIEEALPYYQTLLSLQGYFSQATAKLLMGYFRLRRFRPLWRLLRKLVQRHRADFVQWQYWIKESFRAGHFVLAYLLTKYVLRIHRYKVPSSLYYWHAALALRHGQLTPALHSLEQALLSCPTGVGLFYQLTQDQLPFSPPIQYLLSQYAHR